jgi:hypothetical protein
MIGAIIIIIKRYYMVTVNSIATVVVLSIRTSSAGSSICHFLLTSWTKRLQPNYDPQNFVRFLITHKRQRYHRSQSKLGNPSCAAIPFLFKVLN